MDVDEEVEWSLGVKGFTPHAFTHHRRCRVHRLPSQRSVPRPGTRRHRRGLFCPLIPPPAVKEPNIPNALAHPRFHFHESDMRMADLGPVLE